MGAGFVTTPSGWLSAPKEGSDIFYENNANCMWLIEVHESKAIQIQFHEMDIEEEMVCEYDYIKVAYISFYSASNNAFTLNNCLGINNLSTKQSVIIQFLQLLKNLTVVKGKLSTSFQSVN